MKVIYKSAFAVTAAVKQNHKLSWYNKATLLYHTFLPLYHYYAEIVIL